MYLFLKTIYKCLFLFLRFILAIIDIVLFPVFYLLRFKKKKIAYFSLIIYDYIKARPQIICDQLCKKGYKVVYYSVKDANINYSTFKNKIESNIIAKDYVYNDNHKALNRIWLLFKSFFINYDKVIITNPTQVMYIDLLLIKLKGTKIIYDCMDLYKYWIEEKDYKYFDKYEKILCNYSNVIITSSNALKNDLVKKYSMINNKIKVVKNGYSFDNISYKKVNVKHPNVMYIGSIDDYFDFDTVIDYAKRNKRITIYLIGPITSKARKHTEKLPSNIIVHKPIIHSNIPTFIKKADVLIMPFIVNDMIKCVDPIKLYEYIFFEKPVVCSYWDELKPFGDFVYFYDGDNFEKVLNTALKCYNINHKKLDNFLKKSTWQKRVEDYIKIIK